MMLFEMDLDSAGTVSLYKHSVGKETRFVIAAENGFGESLAGISREEMLLLSKKLVEAASDE